MALNKTITFSSGITGDYIRIINFTVQADDLHTETYIGIYKSKADRDAGKDAIEVRGYNFTGTQNPAKKDELEISSPYKLIYEHLKTLSEYSGATDI